MLLRLRCNLLTPELPQETDRFVQRLLALPRATPRDTHLNELPLDVADAEADDKSSAAHRVDVKSGSRHDHGVLIVDAGHQRAEANALRRGGDPGQGRPAAGRGDRVVAAPEGAEAQFLESRHKLAECRPIASPAVGN